MTLTQLKYVITIADTGSMNEAAKLLFISQRSRSWKMRSGQSFLREATAALS